MNKATLVIIALLFIFFLARKPITKKVLDMTDEQLTPNFYLRELLITKSKYDNTPSTKEKTKLKWLAEQLQKVRDLLGVPIRLTSAFRSEAVNNAAQGHPQSQHRLCEAADFVPSGMTIDEAMRRIYLSNIPYDQLIIEQNENDGRWIHISFKQTGKIRKQALVAVDNIKDGKQDMKYSTYTV